MTEEHAEVPYMVAMVAAAKKRNAKALALRTKGKTLQEIGDHFGVSRERARQMVKKASEEQ